MANRLSIWLGCAVLLAWASPAVTEGQYEWRGARWVPATRPAKVSSPGEPGKVRSLLDKGQAEQALKAADEFLKNHPQDEACEEVMMLAGLAEMSRGRYYEAFERFEKQIQRYPNGRFLEQLLGKEFEIAEAFLGGKKRIVAGILSLSAEDEGLEILTRVAEHAPRAVAAEKALVLIGDHYFAKGRYSEAATAYDRHLEQFDKSKLAAQVMLRAAQAAYGAYRGSSYDETPLLEAEQRFKLFAERYPAEAAKARVTETLERIADLRAQKVYETGRFYDRAGRQDAAVFYYRRVTKEFPQTIWAKEARAGLIKFGKAGPAPKSTEDKIGAATRPAPSKAGEGKSPAPANDMESRSDK